MLVRNKTQVKQKMKESVGEETYHIHLKNLKGTKS